MTQLQSKLAAIRYERTSELHVGAQVGHLTLLNETQALYNGKLLTHWRVRCVCGEIRELLAARLLFNRTGSCGCMRGRPKSARPRTVEQAARAPDKSMVQRVIESEWGFLSRPWNNMSEEDQCANTPDQCTT